jgi:hypothetical protein
LSSTLKVTFLKLRRPHLKNERKIIVRGFENISAEKSEYFAPDKIAIFKFHQAMLFQTNEYINNTTYPTATEMELACAKECRA